MELVALSPRTADRVVQLLEVGPDTRTGSRAGAYATPEFWVRVTGAAAGDGWYPGKVTFRLPDGTWIDAVAAVQVRDQADGALIIGRRYKSNRIGDSDTQARFLTDAISGSPPPPFIVPATTAIACGASSGALPPHTWIELVCNPNFNVRTNGCNGGGGPGYYLCEHWGVCKDPPCTQVNSLGFSSTTSLPTSMRVLIANGTGSFARYGSNPQTVAATYGNDPAGWNFGHNFGSPNVGLSGRLATRVGGDPSLHFTGTLTGAAASSGFPCGCVSTYLCGDLSNQTITDPIDFARQTETIHLTSGCGSVDITLLPASTSPPPPPPPGYFACIGGVCTAVGYVTPYLGDPTCGGTCTATVFYECILGVCTAVSYVTSHPNDPSCGGCCVSYHCVRVTYDPTGGVVPRNLCVLFCAAKNVGDSVSWVGGGLTWYGIVLSGSYGSNYSCGSGC